jgi:RNA polymerase sigma-70 factor (ECF subfamily)
MNQVYSEVENHIPHLRRYARAIAHNPTAAEDLLQDCLTRALTKSHLFKPGTNLRAWLFTILHNEHVSTMRRQGQTGVRVDPDDVAADLATRPEQDKRLLVKALDKALMLLPKGQRALIMSVAWDGLSYEQVARRSGLPVGTVKSRVSRGRAALRRAMDAPALDRVSA